MKAEGKAKLGLGVATRTYYEAKSHGLKHDPLKAIVAPRPIGWISTFAEDGTANLAPYSFFNLVSDRPKIVMFASVGWKDSATNAAQRGAFAANLATGAFRDAVNASSAAFERHESEFSALDLAMERCTAIDAPMIAEADAVLECTVTETLVPKTASGSDADAVVVFGEVVGFHIADALMRGGRFDSAAAGLLSRLGYFDYGVTDSTFEMKRP